jgi:hypothetical protein
VNPKSETPLYNIATNTDQIFRSIASEIEENHETQIDWKSEYHRTDDSSTMSKTIDSVLANLLRSEGSPRLDRQNSSDAKVQGIKAKDW